MVVNKYKYHYHHGAFTADLMCMHAGKYVVDFKNHNDRAFLCEVPLTFFRFFFCAISCAHFFNLVQFFKCKLELLVLLVIVVALFSVARSWCCCQLCLGQPNSLSHVSEMYSQSLFFVYAPHVGAHKCRNDQTPTPHTHSYTDYGDCFI